MKWIVLALALLAPSVAQAQLPIPGFQKTRQDRQREAAGKWSPVAIDLHFSGAEPLRETRVVRVRVWAARDYRQGTREWSSKLRRNLDKVNGLVARWPNVRFEVVDLRSWERDSTDGGLEGLLVALEHEDPGDDVDLVLGLVAAMPVVPTQIHNLGMARQGGRHAVIRSLHDLVEYQAAQDVFDELQPGERERVVAARKTHKEQVIFLHEWGHTLGLGHTQHAWAIMNPEYSEQMARFGDEDGHAIEAALKRPARPREVAGSSRISGDDAKLLNQALDAARAGQLDRAWELASSVEKRLPREPEVRVMMCQLAASRPQDASRGALVESACRQALAVVPRDVRAVLALAEAWPPGDDRGLTQAVRADELLGEQKDAPPEVWNMMARLYTQQDLPSLAEKAAQHGDAATRERVQTWAARARRRYVFPTAMTPAHERAWMHAVDQARQHPAMTPSLSKSIFCDAADAQLFVALVRCEVDGRTGRASAKAACDSVLKVNADASRAHLGLGLLGLKSPDVKAAIAELRRAIELDPDEENAWQALAWLYQTKHRAADAAALQKEHDAARTRAR
jgi:tetratricopeptide (TPR) repeat protein